MWMWRSGWKSDLTPRSSGLQLAQEGILHDSKKEEEKETEKGEKINTLARCCPSCSVSIGSALSGLRRRHSAALTFGSIHFSLSLSTPSFIRRRSNMFSFLHIFFSSGSII
jgi:hypothetical protein